MNASVEDLTALVEMNLEEAADYLGISEPFMCWLHGRSAVPFYCPPVDPEDEDNAVTFMAFHLDALRSRLPALSAAFVAEGNAL